MIKSSHYAIYGNTSIKRSFCDSCKSHAFIIDGRYACCDKPFVDPVVKIKVMSEAISRRKQPSFRAKREILTRQENKCLYCEFEFGTPIWSDKHGKVVFSQIHWDHLVPYCYSYNNKKVNFVAACSICNQIKSSKIFETLEEARSYILYQRKRKGYASVEDTEDNLV